MTPEEEAAAIASSGSKITKGGDTQTPTPTPTPTPQPQPTPNPKKSKGSVSSSSNNAIDNAAKDQKDAAAAAAEEERQAAKRAYDAKVQIAGDAKVSAGNQYQWLIDTLGSNKQDLLDQVNTNEAQGLQNLDTQNKQTTDKYDAAKQEILNTYRDLQVQQEKIMRGSGMGQSSRSQEAQLKLNNLMGKDLSSTSKNEADSIALIGQAVTTLKQRALDTQNSIERETKSKLDKAALDYNDQITAIDNNLMLGANEKADAYAAAETQLAKDTAAITSWASSLKVQAEQTMATNMASFDAYASDMTDQNKMLGADLQTKVDATNKLLAAAGFTPLAQNSSSIDNTVGVYQNSTKKYNSAEEVQAALASGEINQSQAERAIASLTSGTNSNIAAATPTPGNPLLDRTKADPLMASVLA